MTATVITGIGDLVTCDESTEARLGLRTDAAVVIEDGADGLGRAGPPGSRRR